MKRIISKLFLTALLIALTSGSIFAAGAKVTYVKGKVEVSKGTSWVALKVGDIINESETISTGFQSEARLNYNGSVMAVPALSRVTLETLQSSDTKETVSLKVDTGAVRSKVTHTEGKRIEYTARTSVAVASVRGTDFTVFANGKAKVIEGAIAYFKAKGFVPPVIEEAVIEEAEGEAPAATETTDSDSTGTGTTTTTIPTASATATTIPTAIAGLSPRGSTVVGAGQTSIISRKGVATKPIVEAIKRATKAKAAVASEAKKDVISASTAATGNVETTTQTTAAASNTSTQTTATTGKVVVKVSTPQSSKPNNSSVSEEQERE